MATNRALPVTLEAADITVSELQIRAIAELLSHRSANELYSPARWDDPLYWNVEATPADRCQYLAIGNSINFRFWEKQGGKIVPSSGVIEGQRIRGSMYLWRRLRCAVEREELSLDANDLSSLNEDQFIRAFTDDEGHFPFEPGLSDRVENLRDLGKRLSMSWNGQFSNVVEAAHGSLDQFVRLCADFRAFDDPVQKLIMVNAIMLTGSGIVKFDKDPLPGVDYHLVKQALRQGLVIPNGSLRRKLVAEDLLDADESLMLRKSVLDALVGVAKASGVSTAILDNLYWLNRRVCADDHPLCSTCPFEEACPKRLEFGLPLEHTRYY